jgi:hypothetical protein
MSDDFMRRIEKLAERAKAASPEIREHDQPKPPPQRPRVRMRAYGARPRDRRTLEQRLLMTFTFETAYRFIVAHTAPPATEDGLELLKVYPELTAAAPELCAQMALAFRYMARDKYAAHFERVAKYHGITP